MLAVKTSDQKVANQRVVCVWLGEFCPCNACEYYAGGGGGGVFGDIELRALVLNKAMLSSLFSARQVKLCWSRF